MDAFVKRCEHCKQRAGAGNEARSSPTILFRRTPPGAPENPVRFAKMA